MRLAFVTTWDPHDPAIWSGCGFHIARALEAQGCQLQYIGPLRERSALYFKAAQLIYRRLWKQDLQRDREPLVLDGYANQVRQKLAGSDAQVVFGVGGIGIAHLDTKLPIVFWADATYEALMESYRWDLPVSKRSRILGERMEAEGLKRAALAIFSSDWAARSAIEDCGADPKKVHVVPFGANIQTQRTREEIEDLIYLRPKDRCRLLFAGTGWHRKGGDIAVEVARQLNANGLETELMIIGSDPPPTMPEFVKPYGFIDKRSAAGHGMFDGLFGGSHFLILPARAEAFGVVLCEAASFGVPALATHVGGIPTIVRNGQNGLLFAPDDPPSIVAAVRDLFADRARYEQLARSSFDQYESRLNWGVAGQRVKELLQTLIA
jgi:glycosyltransferase involved in cell wall biosynthesis